MSTEPPVTPPERTGRTQAPSLVLVSCVVIRTRLASLRTLPSRMAATFNFSPMVRASSLLPLNAKAERRPITR